jgi:hypothetical protein
MSSVIVDGSGKGNRLKVDATNKAQTRSVSQDEQKEATVCGDAYIIGSGVITLTSACQSAMIYLKNNEDRDLVLSNIIVHSGASTCGAENVALVTVQRNPTGLSGGACTTATNNNFGSNNTLTADITAGAEAATLTAGTAMGSFYVPIQTWFETEISWGLPKGASVGLLVTPPASNSSLKIGITIESYLKKEL